MLTRSSLKRRVLLSHSILTTAVFAVLSTVALPKFAHAQSTLVVDEDGQGTAANCNASAPAFSSIQAAVNAAAPGVTIFVCPGTYNEQVVVTTSNVTIRGAGAGSTVLRPTVVTQNTMRPGTTFPVAPILLVDGATGVTVANLTIDGGAADSGNALFPTCGGFPFYAGIYYRVSSGIVEATHVSNIKSVFACAMGILVQTTSSGAGGVAKVALKNNLVDRYGVAGINCIGQTTECTVTGNTIRGDGPVSDLLHAGLIIRAEAKGMISGNVITDHFYLPARGVPESAAGIFLFFAHPSANPHLLQQNVFANNQLNVQRIGTAAAFD